MIKCSKCVLPETHETIQFDNQGVCNVCRGNEYKQEKIDWDVQKKELDTLIDQYKGKGDYDCLIPFSGGKDSAWTVYYLVKEYGLKPLVVRFDHGFLRPGVEENTKRIQRALGVDFHHFTPRTHSLRLLVCLASLE